MDAELLSSFRDLARNFAKKEIAPLLENEQRDGDLEGLRKLLNKAYELGIISSPDPEAPGHSFGVWGKETLKEGALSSVAILIELAKECAGFATAIHTKSIPTLVLTGAEYKDMSFCAHNVIISTHKPEQTLIAEENILAHNLEVEERSPRTGIALPFIYRLNSYQTKKSVKNEPALKANYLGLTAVALGNAMGAVERAINYSNERYQGGKLIKNHSAIKILLGRAIAINETLNNALESLSRRFPNIRTEEVLSLWNIARDLCLEATSNAMQVLGGYGYMEDYRIEKRLRDMMTLRTLPPNPKRCDIKIFEGLGEHP